LRYTFLSAVLLNHWETQMHIGVNEFVHLYARRTLAAGIISNAIIAAQISSVGKSKR
jgi:hypothetical protein